MNGRILSKHSSLCSVVSERIIARILRILSGAKNIRSVRHRPIPSAPNLRPLRASSGVLVCESPEHLLPTILSRVQVVRVPPLPDSVIAARLVEQGVSSQEAENIAHIAKGSYLTAIQMLEESGLQKKYMADFVELMRGAWKVAHKQDYDALLSMRQWSMQIADSKVGRERQKAFLKFVQRQIRENYIHNFNLPSLSYQTAQEQQFSSRFAPFIHAGNVEQIMNELAKAERQIGQNGNAKIIFFDLCLQMIVLIKKGE